MFINVRRRLEREKHNEVIKLAPSTTPIAPDQMWDRQIEKIVKTVSSNIKATFGSELAPAVRLMMQHDDIKGYRVGRLLHHSDLTGNRMVKEIEAILKDAVGEIA